MAASEREHSTNSITSGGFDPRNTGPRKDTNPTGAHSEASNRTKESVAQGQGCIRYPRLPTPEKQTLLTRNNRSKSRRKNILSYLYAFNLTIFLSVHIILILSKHFYIPTQYIQISEPVSTE